MLLFSDNFGYVVSICAFKALDRNANGIIRNNVTKVLEEKFSSRTPKIHQRYITSERCNTRGGGEEFQGNGFPKGMDRNAIWDTTEMFGGIRVSKGG
jgi:hypothetical protein